MVESKLHRVPRGGPPETVYLFQINVEIDLSKNPKVRDIFTDPKVNKEMVAFLQAQNIRIENKFERDGKVTRVELRGSPEGLKRFHDEYLGVDEAGVVYEVKFK
jgi:hypothetical protein